ncbi:MAG: DUF2971 domain-containing protein [Bacteroidetes bacterium]|nr:DUF2971 domain-containing protein [Bacteroidota bacterium]
MKKKLKLIFKSKLNTDTFSYILLNQYDKKVVCFSKNANETKQILMWSHYAGWNGVRLGFEFPKNKIIHQPDRIKLKKILYQNTVKYINSDRDFEKIIQMKHSHWSYENEYRMISSLPNINFNKKYLKEIVFGNFMNEYEHLILFELCIKLGYKCRFRKLSITPTGLNIKPYSKKYSNIIFSHMNTMNYF